MKTRIALLMSLLLIACNSKKAEQTATISNPAMALNQVVGVGRVEPQNEIIQLSAEVGGTVLKVYKNENDTVQAGDVILELKHTIEDATIAQLKGLAAVQEAQIKVDENAAKELQIRYSNASRELVRLQNLLDKGAETQQVVDNAATEMQSFQANLKKLEANVEVSKMKWIETKAQVAVSEAQLNQKFIKAPVKGVLMELNIQAGNYIDSKQIIAQLNPEGRTIAVCEIDELFADKIKVGQTAIIRNFGAVDTLAAGKVYFTASFLKKKSLFTDQAGEKEDRRVREIKILLDNPGNILLNSRIECAVAVLKTDN